MAMWSDEAHFYFNGTVNTQNCRIWAKKKNPQIYTEFLLQSPNVIVLVWIHAMRELLAMYFRNLNHGQRILFSDEAHFWLNGYVKKQNCRIWSEANSQVYVETPLHPEKLTVWCVLWAGGIIGPYFFKNDEGHNVTVNGDRYRAMLTNFFIPELNNHDVQEL
ncbi:uncharacterized protein TNCV_1858041 [Trichonephila clavipes]|nr:uncharacterized protein TNCV_1858041 [Trichonephila clavipes]